jgi:hypothetical protein
MMRLLPDHAMVPGRLVRLLPGILPGLCLITALALGHGAAAAATWQQELPRASLLGAGDFRFFGFRIYSARLWSELTPFDVRGKFALELTYHRSITRDRFVSISLDEMKRLFGSKHSGATLLRWQGHMEQAFTDVKAGEQLIGVHLPGQGCRFYSRERLLAEVADPEFATAFFAIWFDERSRDDNLRRALIGPDRASAQSVPSAEAGQSSATAATAKP